MGAVASKRVNESKYGFSFDVPDSWKQIPLNGSDVSGLLDQAVMADSGLKTSLTKEVRSAAKNGIKFFAIGPVVDNLATDVNIIVTSSAGHPDNSSYLGIADSQIEVNLTEAGGKGFKTSVIHIPFGKELEVSGNLPVSLTGTSAHG